jgi:signal peptidase I
MSYAARRQLIFILVFLVVVILFVTTYRMGLVHGNSMHPTYENGQVVLVRRQNWFTPPLQRNDVVLLRVGRDVIIKRIYRLPGEELGSSFFYNEDRARITGLADYYEQQPTTPGKPPKLIVPDHQLVVIGDNLGGSEDSRVFGPVFERDVLGVVINSPGPPYTATGPLH